MSPIAYMGVEEPLPSFLGPLPMAGVWREPLKSGDAGVEQTIHQMRQLVDEALRDPQIIRLATDIVRSAPAFDDYAEANALYEWVRQNIRFTKDPVNKEKLYPPAELLKIRAGDCDDISMLLGTLLMAVGYQARLMTVAANAGSPEQFSHVYVEGEVPPGSDVWTPMDPARAESEFGVAPPMYFRARWWSLADDSHGDLSGVRRKSSRPRQMSGLGHYPRFRSLAGLGANYQRVPAKTMGDDVSQSAADSSAMIASISQGASNLIRAVEGQPASPWNSFATPYTPGYGLAPTGYNSPYRPSISVSSDSNVGLWLAIGFGALLLFSGHRR
jgi:hypothetical protein